ncbi:MAG: site-specific integrase, partial [Chloroflexi bacterium]|nr:site-specific integrase [Chloroflexota bacterium]
RNVARVVDAPRGPNVERTALMPADVRKLLAALDGDTLRPVYLLAALLGLRQEEALGLRWRDVDFDAGTVQIAQTLKLVGREVIVDEPKSPRSRRTLPLMPLVADSLREHRQHQREQRLQAGSAWHDGGLVFTSQTGGPLRGPSVTRHLQAVLAAAGLPRVTFHDLRHACASIHVALGTSPRVLMAILGHSDATLALSLYAHTDAEMMRASAAALQDFMAPQWAPQVQPTAG